MSRAFFDWVADSVESVSGLRPERINADPEFARFMAVALHDSEQFRQPFTVKVWLLSKKHGLTRTCAWLSEIREVTL